MSTEKLKTHFIIAAAGRGSVENGLRSGKNSPARIGKQALGRATAGAQHGPSTARAVLFPVSWLRCPGEATKTASVKINWKLSA